MNAQFMEENHAQYIEEMEILGYIIGLYLVHIFIQVLLQIQKKREAHYSPHVYSRRTYNNNSYFDIYENYKNNNYDSYLDKSYENNYNYSYKLNKSFDAGYYKKDKEKIKYTTIDERTNHKVFNRV